MRRTVLVVSRAAIVLAVVLGLEVVLAINGPDLPPRSPLRLDGEVIGPDAAGDPLSLLWLGDSTGAGVGASSVEHALPRVVARQLRRPVELTVLAESGARLADVLDEQVASVSTIRSDIVIVGVGSNDVTHLTSRSVFAAGYEGLLRVIRAGAPDAFIVAVGIGDYGGIPRFAQPLRAIAGWRARALDEVVRETAASQGATYIDIFASTAAAFRSDPDRHYAVDDYHPSDAGYRLWAEAILAVLRPLVAAG